MRNERGGKSLVEILRNNFFIVLDELAEITKKLENNGRQTDGPETGDGSTISYPIGISVHAILYKVREAMLNEIPIVENVRTHSPKFF